MNLFRRWQWQWIAPSRVNRKAGDVDGASRYCPRCDPTARAMDYVRHQWIASGIDRE